jgi:hypothetical protein
LRRSKLLKKILVLAKKFKQKVYNLDFISSLQEVINFVRQQIAQGLFPEEICENLMTRCLAPDCQMGGLGGDNMTVILVCFLHGQPYEDLIERCKNSLGLEGVTTQTNDSTGGDDQNSHFEEMEDAETEQRTAVAEPVIPLEELNGAKAAAAAEASNDVEEGKGDSVETKLGTPVKSQESESDQDKSEINDDAKSELNDSSSSSAEPDLK